MRWPLHFRVQHIRQNLAVAIQIQIDEALVHSAKCLRVAQRVTQPQNRESAYHRCLDRMLSRSAPRTAVPRQDPVGPHAGDQILEVLLLFEQKVSSRQARFGRDLKTQRNV